MLDPPPQTSHTSSTPCAIKLPATASGSGLLDSEEDEEAELPPSRVVVQAELDSELTAMLAPASCCHQSPVDWPSPTRRQGRPTAAALAPGRSETGGPEMEGTALFQESVKAPLLPLGESQWRILYFVLFLFHRRPQGWATALHAAPHVYFCCPDGSTCAVLGGLAMPPKPIPLAHSNSQTRLYDLVHQASLQVQPHPIHLGGRPKRP